MRNIFVRITFIILVFTIWIRPQSGNNLIPDIVKINSTHQTDLLNIIYLVQAYDSVLSEINDSNIEKISGDAVPFKTLRKTCNIQR